MHAIDEYGAQRFDIRTRSLLHQFRFRGHAPDPGEPEDREQPQVPPAQVNLPRVLGESGGTGEGMMIVVQLLSGDEHRQRPQVGGSVIRLEVPVTPGMGQPVDDPRGQQGHGDQLEPVQRDARQAEQEHDHEEQQGDPHVRPAAVDMAFHPVVGRAAAVLLHGFRIARLLPIQLRTLQQYRLQADELRTVRVPFPLAHGMMLAVHSHPLPGDDARVHPQPEPEKMPQRGMQIDGPVCLLAMVVKGDGDQRDVNAEGTGDHVAPKAQPENPVIVFSDKLQHPMTPSPAEMPL